MTVTLLAASPARAGAGHGVAEAGGAPLAGAQTGSLLSDAATVYAVFPGYGMGHFLSGDSEGGMRFLVLDLAATAVWMVGPSIVALAEGSAGAPGMAQTAPSAVATSVFAVGLLAQSGLKVWEVWSARDAARQDPKEAAVANATAK
jgi:hypothetical protein